MKRQYVPRMGARVKLRLPEHYDELVQPSLPRIGHELRASVQCEHITQEQADALKEQLLADRAKVDVPGLWSWFEVLEAGPEKCRLRHIQRAVNAPDPAWEGEVPTQQVEPPLGWRPTYDIVCRDREQAEKVVRDWFKRGIHVWTNHDLGSYNVGGKAFTPVKELADLACDEPLSPELAADRPISPHWQYTGVPTETVPAALCASVFRVLVLEQWEPELPEAKAARKAAVEKLRREPGVTVEYHRRLGCWLAQREKLIYQPEESHA